MRSVRHGSCAQQNRLISFVFAALLPAVAACVPAHAPLRLTLAGDVHVDARAREVLAPLAPLFAGSVGVVNLEGPLYDGAAPEAPAGEVRLVIPVAAAAVLADLRVEVAAIANNHAADLGPRGIAATMEALQDEGVVPVGGAAGVAILDEGQRVAITAHDLTGGVPPSLGTDLTRARESADALIATFHVTGPPSYLPPPELITAVDAAVAAGAVVVAAHGTHVVGKVERRGDAIIAWGLGNLAFACECTNESDAIALRVTLQDGRLTAAEVIPIDAGLHGEPARPSADAQGIFDLLESLGSAPLERLGGAAKVTLATQGAAPTDAPGEVSPR